VLKTSEGESGKSSLLRPKRGQGRIFRQKGSPYWYIAYYLRGKEYRESSKSTNYNKAVQLLSRRLKRVHADQIGAQQFAGPRAEQIIVDELLESLREYKLRNGRGDPRSALKILKAHWGKRLAVSLAGREIRRWQDELLKTGYAKATVNRLGQLLGQAYNLARQDGLLVSAPPISRLPEQNRRTGDFPPGDFARLLDCLPEYLQDFVRWAKLTGWRAGSIRSLRWEELIDDKLWCRAQYSKDREAHGMPLVGELHDIVERRRAAKAGPYVFSYPDGRPIGCYKRAWITACCRAGLGKLICPECGGAVNEKNCCVRCTTRWKRNKLKYRGRIFHDLRRTAATELIRSGVPEIVAMKITGHATRSMFDRYNIVRDDDVRRALEQREAYTQKQHAGQPTASRRLQ
jgi:integrase